MNNKKLLPIAIAVIVVAVGVLAYKALSGGGDSAGGVSNEDLSNQIKKPSASDPDFGPIDDRFVIGKTPGGPTGPGSR